MLTKKIQNNMTGLDIINTMSGGNPATMSALASLISHNDVVEWNKKINALDDHNIYGEDIWTLFYICCNYNIEEFDFMLDLLAEQVFPAEEFSNNLALKNPVKIFGDEGLNKADLKEINKELLRKEFIKNFNIAREKELASTEFAQPGSGEQ